MISFTSSGVALYKILMINVLIQTDLPEPVAPAIKRCGILEISDTITCPARFFPIKDPRIAPMTSVVDAVVTSDLKQCKAYISVLGNDEEKEETMKGLNSAVGYIRRELAHSINLRNTPEITFILDDSIEYGVNMSKKIDELNHGSENETL